MMVAGNWKMHHDHLQAIRTVQEIGMRMPATALGRLDVVVHPPFTDLRSVQTVLEDRALPLVLGAQHCHSQDSGAFTGEIAPPMLARLGVRYVLVGHSERRQLFGQTDEQVAAVLRAVLHHHMVPVVCVGESEDERREGHTVDRLTAQVTAATGGLVLEGEADLVVAYEPLWAIGTGATATASDAQEACAHIRQVLVASMGEEAAGSIRILYGGSVTADNAAELVRGGDVDGVLVGGASLAAESFCAIVEAAASVR
jgi:triosephosphate isomerase